MKRIMALSLMAILALALLGGCSSPSPTAGEPVLKIGMLTDQGTIDDKSFNQGTYEGIQRAENELTGVAIKYLKPTGDIAAAYLASIDDLYNSGHRLIFCPGYLFEQAVFEAQDRYPDCKFVILDGTPNDGNYAAPEGPTYKIGDNTVAVLFAEHESGFLAGLASALQIQSGKLGFVGGMEIPAVIKFCVGFRQGIEYANANYNTDCSISDEDMTYVGRFDSPESGQQYASVMFDRGVKVVFGCGGKTGNGALAEAVERRKKGDDVWGVGVDSDQYYLGYYNDNNDSAILTSAMKYLSTASFDLSKAVLDGTFKGGQTVVFNAKSDGIGIPAENPNLSKDVTDKVAEAYAKLKDGSLVVAES